MSNSALQSYDMNFVLNQDSDHRSLRGCSRAGPPDWARPACENRPTRRPTLLPEISSTEQSMESTGMSTRSTPHYVWENQHFPDSPINLNFPQRSSSQVKHFTVLQNMSSRRKGDLAGRCSAFAAELKTSRDTTRLEEARNRATQEAARTTDWGQKTVTTISPLGFGGPGRDGIISHGRIPSTNPMWV